jgi:hypothetical protein
MHNGRGNLTMKFRLTITFLILSISLYASDIDKNSDAGRNFSFGFTGTAGLSDLLPGDSDVETDNPGFTAGGGLVFEKMFTNHLGLHSGIVYRYIENKIYVDDTVNPLEAEWNFHTLTVPFLMILSANMENFSINLLAGFSYINIFDSTIKNRSLLPMDKDSQKALSFINPHQAAATAGINLKLKLTRFSDAFVGVIGDFHPTNLFRSDHGNKEHLHIYGGRIMTGVMFRTDLFPIPEKIF